jgi:N-acetyl-gamma-glutamyl-phosphate reductase
MGDSATQKAHPLLSGQSLDAEMLFGKDGLTLYVFGNEGREQAVVCAVLDNLGKGAAGQAIQNLELMLGLSHA